jgi:hypothetical protein
MDGAAGSHPRAWSGKIDAREPAIDCIDCGDDCGTGDTSRRDRR